ncbi:MAG: aminopeptidase [Cyclobacteriaceae bacterium]|nr:aminopeptidase [Cyclobacteriaceae bacterium]
MKRKIVVGIILFFVSLGVWQHQLIYYGYVQAKGQLSIIIEAKPLEEFLENKNYPDSLKDKIRLVQEVKTYAFDELGINTTENYTSIYNQEGKPLMWVVTACKPFKMEAKMWNFPLIGSFPYKGFFDPEMAKNELKERKKEGYDVGVRNPGGWSTLGWFNDPILSEMLNRNEGQLAELIIHELSHSTIFVKDSVVFNENLASFIGHEGAVLFLKNKYGESSEMLSEYLNEEKDYALFVSHFINGARLLDTLYTSMAESDDVNRKEELKNKLIQEIITTIDTLGLKNQNKINEMFPELPNNTYFMSFLRYQSKQSDLEKEYEEDFDGNLKAYIRHYKYKFPFL